MIGVEADGSEDLAGRARAQVAFPEVLRKEGNGYQLLRHTVWLLTLAAEFIVDNGLEVDVVGVQM